MLVIAKGKLNFPTLSGEPEDCGIVRRLQCCMELQEDGATRRFKIRATRDSYKPVGDFQAELCGGQEVKWAEQISHCFSWLCDTVHAAECIQEWFPKRFLTVKRI